MAASDGQDVAFVGLGSMGLGMALNLARKGFQVRGYDVRSERTEELREWGGYAATSPADAGAGARAAVIMVLTADQAEEVAFGPNGLVQSLPRGAPLVCMSTMSPSRARQLAERAAQAGLRYLDAPVSGGSHRAESGTLTAMVGGADEDLEAVRDVLQGFCQHIFHLGPVGSGSTAKMVNQILVFTGLAAIGEAMAICARSGADQRAVYEVVRTSMGTSAVFEAWGPAILDGSFQSHSTFRIALKDLGIVEEAARELGIPQFMAATATQLFRAAASAGSLDDDQASVARLSARLSGLGV